MATRTWWTGEGVMTEKWWTEGGQYGAGRADGRRGWVVIEIATQRVVPPYTVYRTLAAALAAAAEMEVA